MIDGASLAAHAAKQITRLLLVVALIAGLIGGGIVLIVMALT